MTKISYANLKLKTNTEVKTFDFNGHTIEVLQYLPIEDKYDLIMITLQNALEENIYNPLKMDMFFHLYLVFLYTNITFTDKQKEDPYKLYNTIKSNGLLDLVVQNINDEEYSHLIQFLEELSQIKMDYKKTVVSLIHGFVNDLPSQAAAMKDILDNFDKTKFQEVIEFAKAANGGRDI